MPGIEAFDANVALRFELYNGLFLNLPFSDVRRAGILLPVFADHCREGFANGRSPNEIIDSFFSDVLPDADSSERIDYLFRFVQFAERQVVLFDALEDAAFDSVNDLRGHGTIHALLDRVEELEAIDDLRQLTGQFKVRIVLTAHPTQFYPQEILGILSDLALALKENDTAEVNQLLLQMGKTRFRNKERPTPEQEAESLLWYVEHVFFDALPQVHGEIASFLESGELERVDMTPVVELGFWPGGDRDGNPYVTSDVTLNTCRMLRSSVIGLYLEELRRLERRLTFPGVIERLRDISDRIRLTRSEDSDDEACHRYGSAEEFLEELLAIYQVVEQEHGGLFAQELARLIYRVRIFGFHFASMDVRQDSRVHVRVVGEVLSALRIDERIDTPQDYATLSPEQRIELLQNVADRLPHIDEILNSIGPQHRDPIESLRAMRIIQRRNGERGIHRYIISNTRDEANPIEVWFLARCAGWSEEDMRIDIVPLFETIEDLDHADTVMLRLYRNDRYRAHLDRRLGTQTIMLGFSDGTKDGGYVAANWNIYRAKERLSGTARSAGVALVFFDGRGGPPARGGGNTHMFYRSIGPTIESRQIHLTIQGQTISSNYGTVASARFNTEQLVTAGIERELFAESRPQLDQSDAELIDELSNLARASYLDLKGDPAFLPYLEQMTPLKFYGQTNIASRPTSRSSLGSLQLDSLRAIPFVGAWSQMKQNVPGYFGFGTSLSALSERDNRKRFSDLYKKSLFFRTLVENAMQSLSKTFFPLTSYIADDPHFRQIWELMQNEAERTCMFLLEVSGQSKLLEKDPVIRRSIALRERIMLPVLAIQQHALATMRELPAGSEELPVYEKLVVKSMAAVVNASRNAV